MLVNILRTRHDESAEVSHFFSDDVVIDRSAAQPERDVNTRVDEINDLVSELNLEFELRMPSHPDTEEGRNTAPTKCDRERNPQLTDRHFPVIGNRCVRFFDRFEYLPCLLIVACSGLSDGDLTGGAIQ